MRRTLAGLLREWADRLDGKVTYTWSWPAAYTPTSTGSSSYTYTTSTGGPR